MVKLLQKIIYILILIYLKVDYNHIVFGRKERIENPENYGTLDDVNWN